MTDILVSKIAHGAFFVGLATAAWSLLHAYWYARDGRYDWAVQSTLYAGAIIDLQHWGRA
jgi:hypothetical protein